MKVTAAGYKFNGGVTVAGYENQIQVLSFSDGLQGCTLSVQGGGGTGACKTSFSGFDIMIPLSSAVIDFRSAMLQGKVLNAINVAFVKKTDEKANAYYKIHMENILVSSIQEGAGDESPVISISLSPAKIAWQVFSQKADGSPGPVSSFGWDFTKSTGFNYSF
jgi:type VI protein secretion system component Hcp